MIMKNGFENYKMLTEAFLSNNGIRFMADAAFQVFQNPVLIIDTSFRILAEAPDPSSAFFQTLPQSGTAIHYLQNRSSHSREFLVKDEIEALRMDHIPEILARNTGLHHYCHCFFQCKTTAAGIRIRNTVVAYLIIPEIFRNLTEEECRLVYTFRDLLSQELMKDRSFQRGRDEYMSYLLMDMLTNKYPDEQTIQKRLETVDFKPAEHMNILVIRKRLENAGACSMELIDMQLRSVLKNHIAAVVDDALVILLNSQSELTPDDVRLDLIGQVCTNNDLIAGISSSFSSLSDLVKHYRLATRTALVCQRYIEDHRMIFYDDVFDLALLEYCDRHNHLMDFVHSSILRLLNYDSQYGTDYLYTFWIYTECGCSTQEAARRLFIHKNTLVYRVNKIKEILGSDLTSGKDMFAFQLSMRILRMLGKLAK